MVIGNTTPGVEAGDGKYLTVATGNSPSNNSFASVEIQGGQGTQNRPVGRLDFVSNSAPGNLAISRIESRTSGRAEFKGDLAFSTKDGSNFAGSALQERLTIKNNGNVGIGASSPQVTLDVDGDARIRALSGSGQRNVMADAEGILTIGSSGTTSSGPIVFKVAGEYSGVKGLNGGTTIETDIWDDVLYITNSSFNRTTKRFIVPQSGYYYLHATVDESNTPTDASFGIKFNFLINWFEGTDVNGDDVQTELSGIYRLTAGQEIYVQLRNDSTGIDVRIDGFSSFFEGYRID